MSTETAGTFSTSTWEEHPFAEVEGAQKISRATVNNIYRGEIDGEGTLEYLIHYREESEGTYYGLERVVGRIGGRAGSVLIEHRGTFRGTEVEGLLAILPGSGTGELAGARGTGGFTSVHGVCETPYTFERGID